MKKVTVLFIVFSCFFNCLFSQKIDIRFGGKGFVTTNFEKDIVYSETGRQVIAQNDGTSIVVVEIIGNYQYSTISRYLSDGKLDSSFGKKGYGQVVHLSGAKAVQQSDGKIVVAGEFDADYGDNPYFKVVVVRYNKDGSLDSSFGINGTAKPVFNKFSAFITAIALDSQKNIVVAGYIDSSSSEESGSTRSAIARYKSDGSLDSGFGKGGSLTLDLNGSNNVTSMAVQSDGKILLSGPVYSLPGEQLSLIRLNSDGTFDNTFGKDGKIFIDNKGYGALLAIQTDGKIVVGHTGSTNRILTIRRLNSNGSADVSFGSGGQTNTHFDFKIYLTSIAIQKDAKIILSLWETDYLSERSKDFLIVRYNSNGRPDVSFDGDGVLKTDFGYNEAANSVAVQDDGKILAAGSSIKINNDGSYSIISGKFAFSRYNSNGSPDNTFSKDGKELISYIAPPSSSLFRIVTQPDGKILVGGFRDNNNGFRVARYNSDGTSDKNFGENGQVILDEELYTYNRFIYLENNGKIVVAAWKDIVVYNHDGSLDKTFNRNGILTTVFLTINSIVTQKDGKIVAAGRTLHYTDSIIRYNTDGSVDKSFAADKKFFSDANHINNLAIQDNGRIVGAGNVLARFNTDGSIDNTFGQNGKQQLTDINVNSVTIDVAGKIIVGGYTETGNGYSLLVRFNKDGSADNTFTADFKQLSIYITSFISTKDGEIIMTGTQFRDSGSYSIPVNSGNILIIQLKNNGSLDSGFNGNGVLVTDLGYNEQASALALSDNMLYAAGTLTGEAVYSSGLVVAYNLTDFGKAPTVTLTAPADSTIRLAPAAHIKLSASAADKDGTITKVEFYNGTKLLHTETVFPYGYVWRNVGLGNYTITAKAYDNSGNVATSAPVHISVVPNKAPIVSITSPTDNQTCADTATIHLEAAASDTDGRITNVKFYSGTTLLRTEFKPPYTYNWANATAGTYTITAVAADNWGAHTTSAPVTIRVTSSKAMIVSNKPVTNKTGINEAISVKLYPNPATNIVNLYTRGLQQNKPADISIISVSGIVLKKVQSSSAAQTQLDVSSLAKGVYTIKIVSGDKVMYKQFVKL